MLYKKDALTLRRNWSFLIMFVLLPMGLMAGFSYLHDKLMGEPVPEQHNFVCKCPFFTTVKPTWTPVKLSFVTVDVAPMFRDQVQHEKFD